MGLRKAGKWGAAGVVGAIGTAGAIAAIFLNPKSGQRHRKQVRDQTEAVVSRERAHIMAMVGGGKKRGPSAARIEESVEAELASAGAHGIDVQVRGATVRLRGEVASISDIAAFERIARAVEGVQHVDNILRVSA